MPIQHIHAFLVHPGKGALEKVSFGGTTLALSGGMFDRNRCFDPTFS